MRSRDFLRTLFSKMLFAYLAVTLGLVAVLGVTVILLLRGQEFRSCQENVRELSAQSVQIETQRLAGRMSDADAKEELAMMASRSGTMIDVYSLDGPSEQYYFDSKWDSLAEFRLGEEDLKKATDSVSVGSSESRKYFSAYTDLSILSKFALAPEEGESRQLVIVHEDISFIKDSVRNRVLAVILIVAIGAIIGTILVYYTTMSVVKPIREVNDVVQQYSKGDYNARVPVTNTLEATQLALSFNNMADQLENLESTRRSFVSNVSHELRSPLTSMRGFLEAMQDGTIAREDYDEYIDVVLSETKRMATMVNDLLDLARIESGRTKLKLEVFDVNELIRRVLLTFEARIYERKMEVEIRFAQEYCYVEADNMQINQVLRNLIDNAIKYSPEGSRLRLATYAMRHEAYVSIQDSGQGIPEEDIPHVFDRFYKVEKAHTPTKQGGTGLGLSIVKRIIDQHGQRITLQSQKGKGTTFVFTLKRAPNPKKQKPPQEEIILNGEEKRIGTQN